MSKIHVLIALLVVAAAAGGFYYWQSVNHPDLPPPIHAEASPQPSQPEPASSSPHYPLPDADAQAALLGGSVSLPKSLPQLDDSDSSIQGVLFELFGKAPLEAVVNLRDLIRRLVISIDSADKPHPPLGDTSALLPPEGEFAVVGKRGDLSISPKNEARYRPFVALLDKVEAKKIVAVYVHFYPLFQAAYHDLNPRGYFNDRLVEVLENVLAAPEVSGPLRLIPEGARYKYADPELESKSNGQKALLRMGKANADAIRTKLREIHEILVARAK